MNIVGFVDRFVPKLVADRFYLDATTTKTFNEKMLSLTADFVNKKYDTKYTTARLNETGVNKGLSHHLILSPDVRRNHGRLLVMLAAQPTLDLGVEGVVLTFVEE